MILASPVASARLLIDSNYEMILGNETILDNDGFIEIQPIGDSSTTFSW
jgi:hypothetical protein